MRSSNWNTSIICDLNQVSKTQIYSKELFWRTIASLATQSVWKVAEVTMYDYRIYLRISRPAYKSKWTFLFQNMTQIEDFENLIFVIQSLWYEVLTGSANMFFDPRISRIQKIIIKFVPKFLDFYASIYGCWKWKE